MEAATQPLSKTSVQTTNANMFSHWSVAHPFLILMPPKRLSFHSALFLAEQVRLTGPPQFDIDLVCRPLFSSQTTSTGWYRYPSGNSHDNKKIGLHVFVRYDSIDASDCSYFSILDCTQWQGNNLCLCVFLCVSSYDRSFPSIAKGVYLDATSFFPINCRSVSLLCNPTLTTRSLEPPLN